MIGAAQFLNKVDGEFTSIDLETVHAMAQQAAVVLQNIVIEKMDKSREQELEFLNVVTSLSSELNLSKLLERIISTITKMLDADRSTRSLTTRKRINCTQKSVRAWEKP